MAEERSPGSFMTQEMIHFVCETSVVGVNNAGRTPHPFRRFVWCCLFLAGLGVTVNDVVILFGEYFSYPVTTDYSINFQNKVTFPAVTVSAAAARRSGTGQTKHHRFNRVTSAGWEFA
ncbi:acid-sensing ion channel 5-like [Pollicipes pollicipes]|uniref:acid-sensing ion channel 5-like n=1 Tax=Pollicipes pollicipes TaxID=41117 RepID=UPI001884D34A|nr:acid-sensing ion channel 5-like [Pollicipes pollicipes]